MIVILFLLTTKSIMSSCPCFTVITDESLKEAVYVLYREVVIIAGGAIIIQALNYYGFLKLSKDPALGAVYCILMAIFLWTALGVVLVINA